MALRDVQAYVETHGRVTLSDLSLRFDTSLDTMRDMTDRLVRKGRLERHVLRAQCTKCGAATACALAEYYTTPQATPAAQ
ncbi:FeoC-like transcriptional regulator [Paenirhodobacter sp. CAU 1674]|jgi:Mn-dependent DtxR family transcriptional regulator|uniref:FeoC-like transcriptional regulator n=1 Tax=Paenirhodobacter sp. CAU 1674 TaxID=3032596 RepID=UPI0023DB3900|nr:FeoC-like transcriptional regulator [Paenirhodobacter sp. CAU 1674]MDF2140892.1 FeoC-like transcriptional regulator [Paenirhodobacter sp. CAU 1674]